MTRRGQVAGPGNRDRGSATLWVLTLAVLLAGVGAGLVVGQGVRAARAQASTAADLAALAAAGQLPSLELACREAARVMAAQGSRLASCTSDGATVTVVAARDLSWPLRGAGPILVRSRAGPPGAR